MSHPPVDAAPAPGPVEEPVPPPTQPNDSMGYVPPVHNSAVPAPAPPPANKKNTKIIIAIAALLGVVAVVVGIGFSMTRIDPKLAVLNAFSNTAKTLDSELAPAQKALGLEISDTLHTKPAKIEMDIGVDVPGSSFSAGASVSTHATILMDLPNRRINTDFGIGLSGTSMISGTIILDDDVLGLAVPEFYTDTYGIKTTTLGTDFNKSNLRGLLSADTIDPEIGFNYFDMLEAEKIRQDKDSWSLESGLEIVSDYLDSVKVERVGKTNQLVNGNSKQCEQFTVIVPQEDARQILRGMADTLQDDEQEQNMLLELLNQYSTALNMPGADLYDTIYGLEKLEQELASDVMVDVFVSNNEVVYLKVNMMFKSDVGLVVEMQLGGENHLSDFMMLSATIGGDVVCDVSAEGNHAMTEGVFSTAVRVQLYDDYEDELVSIFAMDVEYDTKAVTDNFKGTVESSDMQFNMQGTVNVENSSLRYDLYDSEMEYMGEVFPVSFTYELETDAKFELPKPDVTMILDMKVLELMELAEEIEENINKWTVRWENVME